MLQHRQRSRARVNASALRAGVLLGWLWPLLRRSAQQCAGYLVEISFDDGQVWLWRPLLVTAVRPISGSAISPERRGGAGGLTLIAPSSALQSSPASSSARNTRRCSRPCLMDRLRQIPPGATPHRDRHRSTSSRTGPEHQTP